MFLIIGFGAGATLNLVEVVDGGPRQMLLAALGAGAALIAALDLSFDLANRARTHALMKRRYFELLADIAEDRKTEKEATACMHRYGADEEPAYHALLCHAWNAAQEMVYGDKADAYEIPRMHSWLKNLRRFEAKTYRLRTRPQRST